MAGRSPNLTITEKQQALLQEFSHNHSDPTKLRRRAEVILLAFAKTPNLLISEQTGMHRNHVGLWRKRWRTQFERLVQIECEGDQNQLAQAIRHILSDLPRSGRPSHAKKRLQNSVDPVGESN